MGKSLNDLNLSDQPLAPQKPTDPRDTAWYRFCREIDDLLATGRYTFAEDTLRGLQESAEARQGVTEGMRRAVRNIEASQERSSRGGGGGWRRRYEGYR